mgnify:CR=1 FL=1
MNDLSGMRFGRWTVVDKAPDRYDKNGYKYIMWNCVCECGNVKQVKSKVLTSGGSKSCGCLTKDKIKSILDKIDSEKLVIVNHRDFIPEEYLPTFNSNTILLNLHRIKGLSENFVFFNDDVFLLKPTKETDFFRKGLPCDYAVQDIISAPNLDPFWDMMINNTYVINKNFKKKACIKKHFFKWFNLKYGLKLFNKNILLYPFNYFTGFYDHHVCASYKKQTFEEVWSKNFELLDEVCKNKFRTVNDITEWVMRYWQLAKGDFVPFNKEKFGTYTTLKNVDASISIIKKK